MWSHLRLLLLRLAWGRELGPWFVIILAAHRRGRGIYWLYRRVWPVGQQVASFLFFECIFCFKAFIDPLTFPTAQNLIFDILMLYIGAKGE